MTAHRGALHSWFIPLTAWGPCSETLCLALLEHYGGWPCALLSIWLDHGNKLEAAPILLFVTRQSIGKMKVVSVYQDYVYECTVSFSSCTAFLFILLSFNEILSNESWGLKVMWEYGNMCKELFPLFPQLRTHCFSFKRFSSELFRNTVYTQKKYIKHPLYALSHISPLRHVRFVCVADVRKGANWILSSMALAHIAPLCMRLTVHGLQIHLQTLSECWAFTAFQCGHVPSRVRYG